MITRREVLQGALAAGTVWTVAPHAVRLAAQPAPIAVIARDSRRAQAFGAAMRLAGSPVIAAGADALPMLDALEALLAAGPRAVCGLTTFATRMVVGHVAAGYGLRVAVAGGPALPPGRFAHALAVARVPVSAPRLHAWRLAPPGLA